MEFQPRPATEEVRAANRAVADPPVRPGDLAAGPSGVPADMTRPRRSSGEKGESEGQRRPQASGAAPPALNGSRLRRPSRAPGRGTLSARAVSSECSDRQHDPTG